MKHIAMLLWFVAACTESSGSGASCPPKNAPTYATWGRTFMQTYCTGCHSAAARDRFGAPPGLDFDTEAEIRAHARAIDAEAAAGPNAHNTDMPDLGGPVHAPPSLVEREWLGEWLACEQR